MTKESWEAGELSGILTQLLSKLQSKNREGDSRKNTNSLSSESTEHIICCTLEADHFSVPLLLVYREMVYMHTAQLHDFEARPQNGARVFLCVCHKNALLQTQTNPILQNPLLISDCLKWNPLIQFQHNACSLEKGRKTISIKRLNAVLRLNILEAYLAAFTCNDTIMDSWWFVSTDLAWNNFNLSCNRSTQPVNYIFF